MKTKLTDAKVKEIFQIGVERRKLMAGPVAKRYKISVPYVFSIWNKRSRLASLRK